MLRLHPALLAVASCLLLLLLSPPSLPLAEGGSATKERTHYDVLELKEDATLNEVKKAYRRLAVKHHPDRNLGNEEEATVRFREVSEAYEVLSDEDARREYDRSLRYGGGFGGGAGGGSGFKWSYGTGGGGGAGARERRQHQRRPHRDPFEQFNNVFKNDPFFADAFKSMDDLFDRHFSSSSGNGNGGGSSRQKGGSTGGQEVDANSGSSSSWIWNTVKDYMPNINVEIKTSTSSSFGGSTTYSSTSRSYGGGGSNSRSRRNGRSGGGGSSYTSRSTRTVIQNGQRVTIQSLEKDGNKIEEKYVGETLIERTINGVKEDVGRISSGGRQEF